MFGFESLVSGVTASVLRFECFAVFRFGNVVSGKQSVETTFEYSISVSIWICGVLDRLSVF